MGKDEFQETVAGADMTAYAKYESLIVVAFLALVLTIASGCILVRDPITHTEVYQSTSGDSESPTVLLRTVRRGKEYDSGPQVRFTDKKGSVWELNLISNDPQYWSLYFTSPKGTKELIPLELIETSEGLGVTSGETWR